MRRGGFVLAFVVYWSLRMLSRVRMRIVSSFQFLSDYYRPAFWLTLSCSADYLLPTLSPDIEMLVLSEEICEYYDIPPYSYQCIKCGTPSPDDNIFLSLSESPETIIHIGQSIQCDGMLPSCDEFEERRGSDYMEVDLPETPYFYVDSDLTEAELEGQFIYVLFPLPL